MYHVECEGPLLNKEHYGTDQVCTPPLPVPPHKQAPTRRSNEFARPCAAAANCPCMIR